MNVRNNVMRSVAVIAGSLLVILLLVTIVRGGVAAGTAQPADTVAAWLNALEGEEEDRGWRYLDAATRESRWQNDREAYIAAAEATDWSDFDWNMSGAYQHDNGIWQVDVEVQGGLAGAPPIFVEHNLAFPLCRNGQAVGIAVWVETPFIGPPTLGPGALTGTADRGECA